MVSSMKELHRLMTKISRLTDKQASISNVDWDGDMHKFTVSIRPNDGLYKNGQFEFQISLGESYPESPPAVWCLTDIYHPNIDNTEEQYGDPFATNVCLNLLNEDVWSSTFGLEGVVLGLLFLLFHPNLEDPLSPHFDGTVDQERFKDNVKRYLAGEDTDDGTTFDTKFKVVDGVRVEDVRKNVGGEVSTNDGPDTIEMIEVTNEAEFTEIHDDNSKETKQSKYESDTDVCQIVVGTEHSTGETNDATQDTINNTEADQNSVVEVTDYNNEDYVPVSMICVEGECVLFFEDSTSDAENDNEGISEEQEVTNTEQVVNTLVFHEDGDTFESQCQTSNAFNMAVNKTDETLDFHDSNDTNCLIEQEGTSNINEVSKSDKVSVITSNEITEERMLIGPLTMNEKPKFKSRKTRYTCGLWSLFKTVCLKCISEFIVREVNNDLVL